MVAIISAYTSQQGLSDEANKQRVYAGLISHTSKIDAKEIIIVCVVTISMDMEFGLLFQKRISRLITFTSRGENTQVVYIIMKRYTVKKSSFSNKLVVCDFNIRIDKETKETYVPKLKIWKLKEAEAKREFVSTVEGTNTEENYMVVG